MNKKKKKKKLRRLSQKISFFSHSSSSSSSFFVYLTGWSNLQSITASVMNAMLEGDRAAKVDPNTMGWTCARSPTSSTVGGTAPMREWRKGLAYVLLLPLLLLVVVVELPSKAASFGKSLTRPKFARPMSRWWNLHTLKRCVISRKRIFFKFFFPIF